MKKYYLAVTMTLIFTISMGGCNKYTVYKTNKQNVSNVKNNIDEDDSLSVPVVKILTGNYKGDNFDNETTKIIEKATGVKLVVYSAQWGDDFRTKQSVMLASNEIPDIMVMDNNGIEIKYATSGALLPLNQYFKQYPNIEKSRKQEEWDLMKFDDGNVYSIPTDCYYKDEPIRNFRMLLYRKDWLDKFNQKIPETLDEYYKVADTVSNKDPDGDGKKDTYAISGNKTIVIRNTFDHIFGAFGVQPNYWFEKDGTIVNGSIRPEAKEALKFINKMYREGMIDPDFITDDENRQKDKFLKGMYSGSVFYTSVINKVNNSDNSYNIFKSNVPDGEFVTGKLLSTPGYTPMGFRNLSRRGWMRTAIMAQSKVIDAALRVLDFSCSEEGEMLYNFGVKNVDYKVQNGQIVPLTNDEEEKRRVGINLYHIPIVRTELWPNTTDEYSKILVNWTKTTVNSVSDELPVPEIAEYENYLNAYTDDQFSKMIMGVIPIDPGFDQFVKEWKARGGEKALNALNKAYHEKN